MKLTILSIAGSLLKNGEFVHNVCHCLLASSVFAEQQQHCLQASSGTRIVATPLYRRPARSSNRRGAVLLVAIVCVAITSVVFIALLQLAVAQEDAIRSDARELQASWLAESAVDRGAARLRSDEAYRGETWDLPAELLLGSDAAAVEIEIETVPGQPQVRRINVQVDYPAQTQFRSRQNKSVIVTLGGDKP